MIGGEGEHDYITGMFTVLKVRDGICGYEAPGWYDTPAGTLSVGALPEDLRRDGIDVMGAPGVEEESPG